MPRLGPTRTDRDERSLLLPVLRVDDREARGSHHQQNRDPVEGDYPAGKAPSFCGPGQESENLFHGPAKQHGPSGQALLPAQCQPCGERCRGEIHNRLRDLEGRVTGDVIDVGRVDLKYLKYLMYLGGTPDSRGQQSPAQQQRRERDDQDNGLAE